MRKNKTLAIIASFLAAGGMTFSSTFENENCKQKFPLKLSRLLLDLAAT